MADLVEPLPPKVLVALGWPIEAESIHQVQDMVMEPNRPCSGSPFNPRFLCCTGTNIPVW